MVNEEIELKYKVNKLPNNYEIKKEIIQTYFDGKNKINLLYECFHDLDVDSIHTYRVRKIKENDNTIYIVTLKTKGNLYSRLEYEKEIDQKVYESFIEGPVLSKIIKNRYICKKDNFVFEFDEYLNLKNDLITCEIELDSENKLEDKKKKIESILKDDFLIDFVDVTFDYRYKNSNLNKYF